LSLHATRYARIACLCVAMAASSLNPATPFEARSAEPVSSAALPLGRLPTSVRPTHYSIEWRIDPSAPRFSGHVLIDAVLSEPTNTIWLHSRDLVVDSLQVVDARHQTVSASFEQVHGSGVARISLAETLGPQRVQLRISFAGDFNAQLQGLYSIHYLDRTYALTQFEATSARLAFPCFDEPAFKTPFDIALTIPSALQAISNAPQLRSEPDGKGFKTVTFAPTKPLPTYLLALAVGRLDFTEGSFIAASGSGGKALVRVVRLAGDTVPLESVLERTVRLAGNLTDYLGIAYPFEKLDVVVAPDFAGSGMENAGAVFYRESDLIVPEGSGAEQRKFSQILQAHELAHQWFGNLVTPRWWDDLWLKEGFATFLSYRAADGWKTRGDFDRLYRLNSAAGMEADSLASALPVRRSISTTGDIDAAYDAVAYNKSAALLGMYEGYMGEARFRSMLQQFLGGHSYGTASAQDFVDALSSAAAGDALQGSFQDFWDQPGIPEIRAEWSCTTGRDTRVTLRQSRYRPLGSAAAPGALWRVPVCLSFQDRGQSGQACEVLKQESAAMTLPSIACETLFPNAGGRGYYRWNLPIEQWQTLLRRLPALEFAEALSLADNLGAAFRSGRIDAAEFLRAAKITATSKYPEVAFALARDVVFIRTFAASDELRGAIDRQLEASYLQAARSLLSNPAAPASDKLAWQQAAARLLGLEVGTAEIQQRLAALGAAASGFNGTAAPPSSPDKGPPRDIALAAAVRFYGAPFVQHLIKSLTATSGIPQRGELLQALAWAPENNGISAVTELLSQRSISDTEAYELLLALGKHPDARKPLMETVARDSEVILKRLPTDRQGAIPYIVSGGYQANVRGSFRAGLCSEGDVNEFTRVFSPITMGLSGGPQFFSNAVEQLRLCTRLAEVTRERATRTPTAR
jgi:cytosol alanyl aminopeptidase